MGCVKFCNIKMGGDFVGEVIKGVVALEKTESGSNWGWEMSHILCVTECIQKLGGGGSAEWRIRLHTIHTIVEEVSRVLNHVGCDELCDCS